MRESQEAGRRAPYGTGAIGRNKVAGLAVLAAVAVSLTGCGDSAAEGDKKAAEPEGVVTEAEAAKIVDRYVSVNNRANKTNDGKLLSTVEGGALLEQSQAGYKADADLSKKEQAASAEPFSYVDRTYLIPRKGKATWFAVKTRTKDKEGTSKYPQLIVFDRDKGKSNGKAAGGWKNVASVSLVDDEKKTVPLAKDEDGFVRVLPTGSGAEGSSAKGVEKLSTSLADLYTIRGPLSSSEFADTKAARSVHEVPKEVGKDLGKRATAQFKEGESEHEKIYTFRTRDKGTYAVFNTAVDVDQQVIADNLEMVPAPNLHPFVGKKPSKGFSLHWLHQSSAVLPAHGKPQLLDYEVELTSVRRLHHAAGAV
ncbi:hypothetical protein [Streptomyces qinglanensis]|uniref:hypothetical protein n=1 Tax=Streptomyces qinglanensis TaxID=943816 RepID=UPI003788504E